MSFGEADNRVYLVPVIDVNWLVYAPFDPGRDYRVDPPDVPQSTRDTKEIIRIMADQADGKCVLTPHSGTYCRNGLYEGEILDVYRRAVAQGGEVSVHLHEEIKGQGTRYHERGHMTQMVAEYQSRLQDAGMEPVAYRAGHYAYHPLMNEVLEQAGLLVDYSCCPGMSKPDREAIWVEAGYSAEFLPDNVREPWAGQHRSNVLEIPIGSDGAGASYENILHIEQSGLDNLRRVWDAVVARAEAAGVPQIVHCLFHTASVGKPDWLERFQRFLDMVPERGGQFVSTREAQRMHASFSAGAAQ